MDIITKTKNGGFGEEDELDDEFNEGGNKGGKYEGNDGKREECKQQ